MKKFIKQGFLFLIFLLPIYTYADPIGDLVNMVSKIEGYQQTMTGYENTIQQMATSINTDLQNFLSGTDQWGTWQYTDYQSWGDSVTSWQNVLSVAQSGGNASKLGQEMQKIANQFPINTSLYNSVDPNSTDQKYYALQAQTALAARAASQLGYDKIQDQINYANNLRQQIGTTQTTKQSIDLQNRLILENNLIQLEVLRQLALINQQQSVESLSEVNSAIKNTNFLNPNNQ